jgi:hypothetical protein
LHLRQSSSDGIVVPIKGGSFKTGGCINLIDTTRGGSFVPADVHSTKIKAQHTNGTAASCKYVVWGINAAPTKYPAVMAIAYLIIDFIVRYLLSFTFLLYVDYSSVEDVDSVLVGLLDVEGIERCCAYGLRTRTARRVGGIES